MSVIVSEQLPLLAAAPNGIRKLRELVVELAMRGKLVPTNKIKWQRRSLGEIGAWGSGGTPLKTHPEYYNGDIPWLVIGDLNEGVVTDSATKITIAGLENSSAKLIPPGTVLIAMYGSIGKLGIAGIECATNQAIAHCQPTLSIISSEYLLVFLRSVRESLIGSGQGLAQQNISQKILKSTTIDLPPLDIQAAIVTKVDELMALCDRLEAQQADAESAHAQLVAALLDSLTQASGSDDFAASWQRLSANFHTLFTTESSIDLLKQTVLKLAVRGKLVSQDSNDEPINAWVSRIEAEKRSATTRAVKKESKVEAIGGNDRVLPQSWQWATLGELIFGMDSGWSPACEPSPSPNNDIWGVLKTTAVQPLQYRQLENKKLPADLESRPRMEVRSGDILFTRAGPTNRVGISCFVETTRPRLMISDKIIRFHPVEAGVCGRYLALCLNTGRTARYLGEAKSGMAASQVNISQEKLQLAPIPLAPLPEQRRIVAKVDQLMALCDQLKIRLTEAKDRQAHLTDALVEHAVA